MPTPSTQQSINIAGIKDGVIVMKDGGYRLVLQVSATNFALKSEQEQNSIIFQYQSFLNSLHFPIEIVVSSRRLDLTPYIAKIQKIGEAQTSELLKMQTTDYIDFLKKLIDIANIMKKVFYVVIPYEPLTIKKLGFFDSLLGKKSAFEHLKISDEQYKADTTKLTERATTVANGLGSMGLHCFQLSTEDLIELFYLTYNPDEASKERIKDATMLTSPVVMSEKEFGGPAKAMSESPQDEGPMIDNSAIVAAQREEESRVKQQENLKEAERQMKANPAATPTQAPQAPQPAPANTVAAPDQSGQSAPTIAVAATPPAQQPPAQTPPPATR